MILALIRKSIKQPLERSNKPQSPDKGQLSPRSLWVKLSKRIIPTALPSFPALQLRDQPAESQIQAASKNSPNARFLQNQSLLVVLLLVVVLLLWVVLLLLVLLQV